MERKKMKKIILVFKTHFDIGFTDLSSRVIDNYAKGMLEEVIETCEKTQDMGKLRYVWTMPAWPLLHIVQNCAPGLKEKLDALIENGQVAWHALPFTSHTDFCSQKEYLEGLKYSRLLAEQAKELYPDAEVVCGTMDDFYRELSAYDLSGVPVVAGDLADTWIHGVGAYPQEVSRVRRSRRKMEGLQALWLGRWLAGEQTADQTGKVNAERCLEQYYEQIALFEEHTWGADVKTWLGPDRAYEKEAFLETKDSEACRFMERSWEEQRERARKAEACVKELEGILEPEELSESDGTEEDTRWLFCGRKQPFTGWVRLPERWEGNPVLVDGTEAECGWIGGNWCCYVENLPGFTSVAVRLSDGKAVDEEALEQKKTAFPAGTAAEGLLSLENHRYHLIFCKDTGAVISLWDKKLQCALLKGNAHQSALAYQYDKYGYDDINEYLRHYGYHFTTWGIQDYGRENYPVCPHETFVPAFVRYELTEDRVRFFYSSQKDGSAGRYGNAEEMELSITLPAAGDEIFMELFLKNKQESPFVESGSFRILPGEKPLSWRMQKGGVLLDPEKDIVKKANHSLACVENGMTAFGKQTGFCLKTPDAPLVSLNGTGIYHFAPEFEAAENGGIYVNLFNNMWGTNFPQWMGGDLHYSFVLEGLSCEEEAELSDRLNRSPEEVRLMKESLGSLPMKLPAGMRLIGTDPTEGGMILQLSETFGTSSARTLAAAGCRITPVDLYGRAQGESREEAYTFEAVAFGVQAFLLEKAGSAAN